MRLLLILMMILWVPVVHAEDPDVMYEKNVQNRLMDNFDWQITTQNPAKPLNNIVQFGKDFRIKPQFEKGSGCFSGDSWNSEVFRFVRGYQSWVAYSHVRPALRLLKTWARNPVFVAWYVHHKPDRAKSLESELNQMAKDLFSSTEFDQIMRDVQKPLRDRIISMNDWLQQMPWVFEDWIDISEEDFNAKTQAERKQIRDELKKDFGQGGVISKVFQLLKDDQRALPGQVPEVSFDDVDDPLLAVSQTSSSMVLDFQQACRFAADGISQMYSHKGCVCRVEIPTAVEAGTPIKFTLYKWGYAHYTDILTIPAEKFADILAEFRLLRQIVDQKLTRASQMVERQKVPIMAAGHSEPPGFALDRVMFGDHKSEVLAPIETIRTESE